MDTGAGKMASSSKQSGLGQAGGRPVEAWIAAALLALSGTYLIVRMFRPAVRRDLYGFDDVLDPVSWWIFWPWFVLFVVGFTFLAAAWVVLQVPAIGYRLVGLLSVGWTLSVLFAWSPDRVAWLGRERSYFVMMVATLAAAAVIVASPVTRTVFASPAVARGIRPTSVMVVRAVMFFVASALLLSSVLDIVVGRHWVDVEDGLAISAVLLLASLVLLIATSQLSIASRAGRVAVSILGVALLVLGVAFGNRTVSALFPLAMAAVVPIGLWLPPDARRFFGDIPLAPVDGGPAVGLSQSNAVSGASIACQCGSALGLGDLFCGKCGTPKPEAPTCKTCGTTIDATQMFCHGCGATVHRDTTAVTRVAPSAGSFCSACGLPAKSPRDRFCASCGHQVRLIPEQCRPCHLPDTARPRHISEYSKE